jgi:hypothetical protein
MQGSFDCTAARGHWSAERQHGAKSVYQLTVHVCGMLGNTESSCGNRDLQVVAGSNDETYPFLR